MKTIAQTTISFSLFLALLAPQAGWTQSEPQASGTDESAIRVVEGSLAGEVAQAKPEVLTLSNGMTYQVRTELDEAERDILESLSDDSRKKFLERRRVFLNKAFQTLSWWPLRSGISYIRERAIVHISRKKADQENHPVDILAQDLEKADPSLAKRDRSGEALTAVLDSLDRRMISMANSIVDAKEFSVMLGGSMGGGFFLRTRGLFFKGGLALAYAYNFEQKQAFLEVIATRNRPVKGYIVDVGIAGELGFFVQHADLQRAVSRGHLNSPPIIPAQWAGGARDGFREFSMTFPPSLGDIIPFTYQGERQRVSLLRIRLGSSETGSSFLSFEGLRLMAAVAKIMFGNAWNKSLKVLRLREVISASPAQSVRCMNLFLLAKPAG